jgi:hypothetical protein
MSGCPRTNVQASQWSFRINPIPYAEASTNISGETVEQPVVGPEFKEDVERVEGTLTDDREGIRQFNRRYSCAAVLFDL